MAATVTLAGFDIAKPSVAPTVVAGTITGTMGAGAYLYKVTFKTAFGETDPSVASSSTTTGTGSMSLSAIPVSTDSNVTSRALYRTASAGSTYYLLATIANNTTTTYTDIIPDATLTTGAAITTVNTAGSREIHRGYIANTQPYIGSVTTAITATPGGGQANAVLLTAEFNLVGTTATIGDSVKLPVLTTNLIGMRLLVKNNGAASLAVFPASGQFINALSADASVTITTGALSTFVATSATTWTQF